MRKRCKNCGCYLDPGEWCECDSQQDPERDMVKRPIARKATIFPREYNTQEYIQRRFSSWDER